METLLGDPAKAKEKLDWEPLYSFKALVYDMLRADFERYGLTLPEAQQSQCAWGKK